MSTAVETASAEMRVRLRSAISPSGKLGVWWFIASEIMVFGGLIGSTCCSELRMEDGPTRHRM